MTTDADRFVPLPPRRVLIEALACCRYCGQITIERRDDGVIWGRECFCEISRLCRQIKDAAVRADS